MSTLSINFHKLAKFVNFIIPISAIAFFLAGIFVSFYFHFLSIAFIFLTVINYFYLNVQTQHSILRNFGMVGQLRYMLESLGPELRQYLFSSDTEEKPFNREERSEVYRKSKGVDSALSFGSQNLFDSSEIKFRHSLFPVEKNKIEPYKITFGEERGIKNTYTINKHIMISAMSFGALGEKAIYSLARGAKMAKIPMNTGEGGYPKHHLTEGCDLIFQLGTAKFGARHLDGTLDQEKLKHISQNPEVKMIEIKLSQGAKPGKGGLLLKEKITDEISELRGVSKDHDIVSPMYHRECQDLESMVQFINNIQEISQLPVGIKICIGLEDEFRAMIQEMKKQDVFPDYIAIDGAEGGTGAAPKAYMDHFGLPLFSALKIVQKILIEEQSRGRVKIIASGKLINIGKQMMALSLGADVIYSARGFMLALGCIQALQCARNTCPIGIATQDPLLQKGLVVASKAKRVQNYVDKLEHEFYELAGSMGIKNSKDLSLQNLFIPSLSAIVSQEEY